MRHYLVAASALALISCGGGGNGNEATAEKAADPGGGGQAVAGTGEAMQPGLWETTVQVAPAAVANLPAGVEVPSQTFTARTCLTAEQTARPGAEVFGGGNQAQGGCTYESFSAEGGRIRGSATCSAQGATMRMTMEGQFGATSYEMTQRSEIGGTTTETRISGRRVGDCPG